MTKRTLIDIFRAFRQFHIMEHFIVNKLGNTLPNNFFAAKSSQNNAP